MKTRILRWLYYNTPFVWTNPDTYYGEPWLDMEIDRAFRVMIGELVEKGKG